MKYIYYIMAFIVAVATFSACNPLDKTYKDLGDVPEPVTPAVTDTIALSAADYGKLPASNYAQKSLSFKTIDDAKAGIPIILAAKYPTWGDKSSVTVTYANSPATITLEDSVFTHVAYTLVNPTDYYVVLPPTAKNINFSAANVLSYLNKAPKYANPVANQLAVLTFEYYESGVTSTATQSFLYIDGAWKKIYTISAAQYNSVGKGGTNNDFASADAALLPQYFNTFLKADPAVMVNAKMYVVIYVSYKYYGGSAGTFQRVLPLTFDGANWITTPVSAAPLAFVKTNGTWVADNTVTYTLVQADYTIISTTTAGTAGGRASIAKYPDFNVSSTTDVDYWSNDQIIDGLTQWLKIKYPGAIDEQKFNITYTAYSFGKTSPVTKTFKFTSGTFVLQ